jgi:hypothetical protein
MKKSMGKNCGRFVIATVTFSLFSISGSWAQDSNSSGAMGGLRGPQDIINSVNNRDSYGNPIPGGQGGYGAPSGGEPAGTIQPFTGAGDPNAGSQGAYLPPPAAGAAGNYGAAAGNYGGAAGNYGAPPGSTTPFQGGPPPKQHHHKHQSAFQQSQAASQLNGQPGQYPNPQDQLAGQQGYQPGGYPNPGMSGPPPATSYHSHSGSGGNSSVGGAVVGVPDRAAKTAVGGSLKAGKEVLKALF